MAKVKVKVKRKPAAMMNTKALAEDAAIAVLESSMMAGLKKALKKKKKVKVKTKKKHVGPKRGQRSAR